MGDTYVLSHDVIFYHCYCDTYLVKNKPEHKKVVMRGEIGRNSQKGVSTRALELLNSDQTFMRWCSWSKEMTH